MTVQRLLLELETGGNVRFEDGKPTDPWYKSCHDLFLSRFCVGDYLVGIHDVSMLARRSEGRGEGWGGVLYRLLFHRSGKNYGSNSLLKV